MHRIFGRSTKSLHVLTSHRTNIGFAEIVIYMFWRRSGRLPDSTQMYYYIHRNLSIYLYIQTDRQAEIHTLHKYIHNHTYMYACMHDHACMHAELHINTYTHTMPYIHTCIHGYFRVQGQPLTAGKHFVPLGSHPHGRASPLSWYRLDLSAQGKRSAEVNAAERRTHERKTIGAF